MTATVERSWEIEAWRAVMARIADPHPFVTPEWQRAWWEHFGTGELRVLRLPGAVAALHVDGTGTARFLGGEDLTDYPGPAVAPGAEQAAADGLLAAMRRHGWRALDVRNQRPEDGFADALGGVVTDDEPVAILDLPDTWDAYLAELSRHQRHELRRKLRGLANARVRTASPAADLATFARLMRLAPGAKGVFLTPRIEGFFARVAHDVDTFRLDVLELEGVPLASTIGFQTRTAYYLYNMSFDPAAAALSPGIVLLGRLIRRAIADGLERFDFLRGCERYKLDLGATAHHLRRVIVRWTTG